MAERRRTLRLRLTIILALSLLVCPLSVSGQLVYAPAQAQGHAGQIDFTPHVATLVATGAPSVPTLGVLGTPAALPTPTIGPGQVFRTDNRPELLTTVGDEDFGYGRIDGYPGLFLVWATDANGTRYMAAEGTNPHLLGGGASDSFAGFVAEMQAAEQRIADIQSQAAQQEDRREGFDIGAIAIIAVGGLVCGVLTGGVCAIPFAAGALALVGQGMASHAQAQAILDQLPAAQAQLAQAELNVRGMYEVLAVDGSTP